MGRMIGSPLGTKEFTRGLQNYVRSPEDLAQMAFGTGLMFLGAGGEVGGLALDATGMGAVAGVPINVAAAGAVVGGIATAGSGAGPFIQHARANDNSLQEATGPTEPAAQPPTSNWLSSGPRPSPIEGARTVGGLPGPPGSTKFSCATAMMAR